MPSSDGLRHARLLGRRARRRRVAAAAGEVGEIVVGGEPGITLFAGYLDDPETTAASFDGEWFLTGDRARRDATAATTSTAAAPMC